MGFFNRKDDEEVKKTKVEEETEEEEESETDSYEMEIECENCQNSETYEIPFGTTVSDFTKDEKCEVCGCLLKTE